MERNSHSGEEKRMGKIVVSSRWQEINGSGRGRGSTVRRRAEVVQPVKEEARVSYSWAPHDREIGEAGPTRQPEREREHQCVRG